MNETWVNGFTDALLRHVQKIHPEAISVTGWDDSAYEQDGCSCYSGIQYEVDIYYMTDIKQKYPVTYTYNGRFTSLIEELTS